MNISFNNQEITVTPQSLQDLLLLKLGEIPQGIAVAINGNVIRKNDYLTIEIKENDQIMVITATAGG